jgi:hypothetical protein
MPNPIVDPAIRSTEPDPVPAVDPTIPARPAAQG